jgi:hypothetical protein
MPVRVSKASVDRYEQLLLTRLSEPDKRCDNFCPSDWAAHWREWHRGHGCTLDPDATGGDRS